MKSTIPHIVLTGSSGFLGQHLLHSLVNEPLNANAKECVVHALYGGMQGFPEAVAAMTSSNSNTGTTVKVHKLDLTNTSEVQAWIDEYVASVTVCIHAAALSVPRQCQQDPIKAQALNVPSPFLEGLAKNHVHIIGLSTDQVYDGTKGNYVETDATNPLNIYGRTKVELENYLSQLTTRYNIRSVSLRSSIILGKKAPLLPEKAHDTFLHFCASRQDQETTFYTDECRSVIAAEDVVKVIRWFVQSILTTTESTSTSSIYNMGGPEPVSRMDMAQAVFRYFNYAPDKLVAAVKADLPPSSEVPSPLDITMDSSKLVELIVSDIVWKKLDDIVQLTFST